MIPVGNNRNINIKQVEGKMSEKNGRENRKCKEVREKIERQEKLQSLREKKEKKKKRTKKRESLEEIINKNQTERRKERVKNIVRATKKNFCERIF